MSTPLMNTAPVNHSQTIANVFSALLKVHGSIDSHGLERKIYHLVLLCASQINGCGYCVKMHTKEAREDGETDARLDSVIVWRHVDDFTPRERAAYLLHDIFDLPYADLAITLDAEEAACRKLVSRAREKVGHSQVRSVIPEERQEALLASFKAAVETGNTKPLSALLSEDITLSADGGGKVSANPTPIIGKIDVLEFIGGKLSVFWRTYEWRPARINGLQGVLLFDQNHIAAAVSFALDIDGHLAQIFIVRNPDKLSRLGRLWEIPLR